jgi:O-antigen ligase
VVGAALAIPLAFAPWIYYVYPLPKLLLFYLAAAFALACGSLLVLRFPARRLRLSRTDMSLLVFLVWLGVATVLSPWPRVALVGLPSHFEGWIAFVGYGVFYFVASRMRPAITRRLLVAIAVAGAGVGLCGLLQIAGVFHPLGAGDFGSRIIATLGNPTYVGSLEALSVPLTIGLFAVLEQRGRRFACCGLLALEMCALLLSFSRGAIVGTVFGLGAAGLLLYFTNGHRPNARRRVAEAAVVVCLIAAGAVTATILFRGAAYQAGTQGTQRLAQLNEPSANSRLVTWRATLRLVEQRPLAGWGEDTFKAEFPSVRPLSLLKLQDDSVYMDRPHNHWLYLAYAGGIPALAIYLLYLGTLGFAGVRVLRRSTDAARRRLVAALVAAVIASEVASLFLFTGAFITPLVFAAQGSLAALTVSRHARSVAIDISGSGGSGGSMRKRLLTYAVTLALLAPAGLFLQQAVTRVWADWQYSRWVASPGAGIAALAQAVRLSPHDPFYAEELGGAYQEGASTNPGWGGLAENAYTQGQASNPWDPLLDLRRAELLASTGRPTEAAAVLESILARDPYHALALLDLAALRVDGGSPDAALPLAQRLVSFAQNDPNAWLVLGVAAERSGDLSLARAAYQTVLRLRPADATAASGLSRLHSAG